MKIVSDADTVGNEIHTRGEKVKIWVRSKDPETIVLPPKCLYGRPFS